jgi:CII-binding regulator of phage lambda lysogenization HflD
MVEYNIKKNKNKMTISTTYDQKEAERHLEEAQQMLEAVKQRIAEVKPEIENLEKQEKYLIYLIGGLVDAKKR